MSAGRAEEISVADAAQDWSITLFNNGYELDQRRRGQRRKGRERVNKLSSYAAGTDKEIPWPFPANSAKITRAAGDGFPPSCLRAAYRYAFSTFANVRFFSKGTV
jgi:hypothetical protein